MKKHILIADKRKELSTKYKKIIESLGHAVVVSNKLNETIKIVQDIEPDLILVSDSIVENIADFCKQLRVLTFNTRPVIVGISKSSELDDKLKVLENGADDFLSEPIQSQEFKMRIYAHLRREQENNVNEISGLPDKSCTLKAIKRVLSNDEKKAFVLLSIENFDEYKSLYANLASDRLVQTSAAIIKSSLGENDFMGQISENEFFAIINPTYVEKISSFLTFAFDSVSEKFYSEQDIKRGYVILQGDEKEGRRSEFIHLTISANTNEFRNFSSPRDVLNSLYSIRRLAQKPSGSAYLIDRPQICAQNSVEERVFNNNVLVLEKDSALSFLLATTIELQGYNVFVETSHTPSVIILDAGELNDLWGLKLCKELKDKFQNTKIIMTSVLHDKEKILNSGADLYLPKPYNIVTLMKWINIFSEEFNT
ncbi:response regulator [bacterium]|nr:response regulator [bacterium]